MADPTRSSNLQDKFQVQNPPENLSMLDVMSMAKQFGGLAKACRYFVRVRPQGGLLLQLNQTITQQLSYMCEAAEMPGRGFMNIDARYYGPNFKLPFQSQYEDTSMTFLCRNASFERKYFDNWMELINPTNRWTFSYRDDYSALIDIYQLALSGATQDATAPLATYQWTLHNAYPVVVNPQQVTWGDENIQRLTITWTYTHWTRPLMDEQPKGLTSPNDFIKGSEVSNLPTPTRI